ncbi:MAG TPA: hypothetical protein VM221_00215, partial [Armatimonadota bacterium]|nr:hypothetical protein [Armatimonadota bacterium]
MIAGRLHESLTRTDGIIADEFLQASEEKYVAWAEAVKRLCDNPAFGRKMFYAWCGPIYERGRRLTQTVAQCGYRFAFERYLPEQPTPGQAQALLEDTLVARMRGWQKMMPGVEKRMLVTLGYMSAPPESLDTDPGVNYTVWMDMQFQALAIAPAFDGLYGMMEYLSSYADEEMVRWAGKLYRHYFIEGHTQLLSTDPYVLPHLQNGDFADALEGWTLQPAAQGSMATKSMPGYSWLQGRYPQTSQGDTFLWTKRSAEGPNAVSQEIKSLEPGRLYSLRLYTADYGDLSQGKSIKQKHAVSIQVESAQVLEGQSVQHVFANCYSHHLAPYDAEHRAWMNFHRKLFRATSDTARLTVSDW